MPRERGRATRLAELEREQPGTLKGISNGNPETKCHTELRGSQGLASPLGTLGQGRPLIYK